MRLKDILLLGLPILFSRFRRKNPRAGEIMDEVARALEVIDNPSALSRDSILRIIDDKLAGDGWSPEARELAQFYAKRRLEEMGI